MGSLSIAFQMKRHDELQMIELIEKLQKEYNNLDQISMQSKEGDDLLARINRAKGELNQIYKWMNQKW